MSEKIEIPGTFRLEQIREAVQAVSKGHTSSHDVRARMDLSPRHVSFALGAARMLGWLKGDAKGWTVTKTGRGLLGTEAGSEDEARAFAAAIRKSKAMRKLAPRLLEPDGPTFEQLTQTIAERTGMAEASAKRGARVLLSWRRQALEFEAGDVPTGSACAPEAEADAGPEPAASGSEPTRPRLASIELRCWGPFAATRAELAPFTAVLGNSGAGKTSLLQAILFVGEALRHGPGAAVRQAAASFSELCWQDTERHEVVLEVVLPASVRPDPELDRARYRLGLGPGEGRPAVVVETLELGSSPANRWRTVVERGEGHLGQYTAERGDGGYELPLGAERLALAALPEDRERFAASLGVRDFLRRKIHQVTLDSEELASPCSPLASKRSTIDGGRGLPLVLRHLAKNDLPALARLKQTLRRAAPEVSEVWVQERSADRYLQLEVRFEGGLALGAWRVSAGILEALALATIAETVPAGELYLIDDLGGGLDPLSIRAVLDRLAQPIAGQILVTSALDEVASCLEGDHYVLQRGDGASKLVKHP